MVEPFRSTPPPRIGLRARLGGRRVQDARRELWHLLGEAGQLRDLSARQVEGICARNGASLSRDLVALRAELYRRFLEHCLLDCALSRQERAELAHLRFLLRLDEEEAIAVHDAVASAVYGDALDRVLQDHRCDPEEEQFLAGLREDLRLSEQVAKRLREEAAGRARERFLSRAAVHENLYVASREAVVELEGESAESLEDAVRDALLRASETLRELTEAELAGARVLLEGGEVKRWRVRMHARLPRDGELSSSEPDALE